MTLRERRSHAHFTADVGLLDDCMDYAEFKMGFWHPFGPHGRETVEQIIQRKRKEIEVNSWTLWSFQYRRSQVLDEWCRHLSAAAGSTAVVFCSHSPGAVDPADVGIPIGTTDCRSYRFAAKKEWQPWPVGIRVPHPFRGKSKLASAFVVQRIIHPVESFALPAVEWLYKGQWRKDRVPTRGEYLIRLGGVTPIRQVGAVLELRVPYLAVVSANAAQQDVPADVLASRSRG